jgi:hypothetical protein
MALTDPFPLRPRAPRRSFARRALPAATLLAGLAALVLALAACSSPLSLDPLKPDPGIAASLRVVESKTEVLFDELSRNAAAPYSDYDALHYKPLLNELANAQKLAKLHERNKEERRMLEQLEATFQQMRRDHKDGKFSYQVLVDYRSKLGGQIDALLRIERG